MNGLDHCADEVATKVPNVKVLLITDPGLHGGR